MNSIIQVICPSCGATLGPDHIYGSIIYCPKCMSYKVLSNNRDVLKPIFYKIHRHIDSIISYKRKFVNAIWESGGKGVFEHVRPISEFRRFYLPVREIYNRNGKITISLNEYDDILYNSPLKGEISSYVTESLKESDFTDLRTTDYKPLFIRNKESKIEFLPVEIPMDKIDVLYDVDPSEQLTVIKFLPITTVDTTIGRLYAIGTDNLKLINPMIIRSYMDSIKESGPSTKERIIAYCWMLLAVSVLSIACFCIYKFLTMGITFSDFVLGVVKSFGYAFIAVWCVIWLMLYATAAIMIFGPPFYIIKVLYMHIKDLKRHSVNDLNKGYKIFGVQ